MTKEAFKELFDQYFDEIRNYLYYRSGDADLSTDLAQDTFLKIWEKRANIYPEKIKSLLFKIAGDLYVTNRRRNRLVNQFRNSFRMVIDEDSPEELLQFRELSKRYEDALASLTENQRVVFLMSRSDNLKYHEIAERLDLSVKAVEKRMSSALGQLRKLMDS